MSLEHMDGFDHYTSTAMAQRKWDTTTAGNGTAGGRYGGNSFAVQNTTGLIKTLTSVQTRIVGGAWLYNNSSLPASDSTIIVFQDSGTNQVDVRTTSAGAIKVTRNGTLLGTSASGVITAAAWHYIEFKCKIDPTVGTYDVQVDGVNVLSGTGANTRNTANSTSNQVVFKGSCSGGTVDVDDIYVCNTSGSVNNNFLGECRILQSYATGDGATTNWTPSTGTNHWANIDEPTPNDDTDYNSDSNVGDIDLYTFPSVSPTGAIGAVQVTMCARKDDAGTRQLSEVCRSGGTNFVGGLTFTMLSTYLMYMQIRETDPNTGSAWTNSGVNSAQFGAKVIA